MTFLRRLTATLTLLTASGVLQPLHADAAAREDPRDSVVRLINQERVQHGLAPVRRHGGIDRIAQSWTDQVARSDDYRHNPSAFSTPVFGVEVHSEILTGTQTDDRRADRGAVQAWINSAPHHEIMLNSRSTLAGVGISCSRTMCYYIVNSGFAVSTIPTDTIGQRQPYRDAAGQWVSPPKAVVVVTQPATLMARGARTVRR